MHCTELQGIVTEIDRYWENHSSQNRESKIVNHVMSMSLLLYSVFRWLLSGDILTKLFPLEKKTKCWANMSGAVTGGGGGRSVLSLAGLLVFSENQEQPSTWWSITSPGRRQTELQWLEDRNCCHHLLSLSVRSVTLRSVTTRAT